MRLIILLFAFTLSCSPYKRVKTLNMTNPKANRIAKKFNFTQPHRSYSDKNSRKRARLVLGHSHHFSY
jgi:hypothetical protein